MIILRCTSGDSLLFAAGTFAALGHLSLGGLMATFITSAILGDAVNYHLGKMFGEPSSQFPLSLAPLLSSSTSNHLTSLICPFQS